MTTAKRAGTGFVTVLLVLSLIGLTWSVVSAQTVRDRETVKGWLKDSDTYPGIVSLGLENLKKESPDKTIRDLPVGQADIQAIVKDALTPDIIEANSVKLLDGVYNWLEGKTKLPEFSLEFPEVQQKISDGVANYVVKRISGLPECPGVPDLANYDPFSADCRPRGIDPSLIGLMVRQQVKDASGMLEGKAITAQDLTVAKDDQGTQGPGTIPSDAKPAEKINIFEQPGVSNMPKFYQLGRFLPIVLGVLSGLLALLLYWLSGTGMAGVKRVGIALLIAGGMILLTALVLTVGSNAAVKAVQGGAATVFVGKLVKLVASDTTSALYTYGGIMAAAGLGAVMFNKLRGHDGPSPTASAASTKAVPSPITSKKRT
jgi:hypothetical protein